MRAVTAAHIEVRTVGKQWRTGDHPVAALEAVSLDVAPREFLFPLGLTYAAFGIVRAALLGVLERREGQNGAPPDAAPETSE